jgi:hypothetical protein
VEKDATKKKNKKQTKKNTCMSCSVVLSSMKRCTRCEVAHYCSKNCQKNYWPTHKMVCAPTPTTTNAEVNAEVNATAAFITEQMALLRAEDSDVETRRMELQRGAISATGIKTVSAGKEGSQTECPISLDHLSDPISPCQVPSHKMCWVCAQRLREKRLENMCPLCRGEMTDAEELFHEASTLAVQADVMGDKSGSDRYCDAFVKLKQAVAIDPMYAFAYTNLWRLLFEGSRCGSKECTLSSEVDPECSRFRGRSGKAQSWCYVS